MRCSSTWSCLRSFRSRAPSGSSRTSTFGSLTSARARATRRCCAPRAARARAPPGPRGGAAARLAGGPGGAVVVVGGRAAALQPERNVAGHVEVGKQGVALEDHVDGPLVGRGGGHGGAARAARRGGR